MTDLIVDWIFLSQFNDWTPQHKLSVIVFEVLFGVFDITSKLLAQLGYVVGSLIFRVLQASA